MSTIDRIKKNFLKKTLAIITDLYLSWMPVLEMCY